MVTDEPDRPPEANLPVGSILDAAPDGMLFVDAAGTITWVNLELERLTGYSAAELIGQPVEVLVPEAVRDRHVALRLRYLDSPTKRPMGVGQRLSGRRRDGSVFAAHISLAPVETERGTVTLASVRDVTEWVEAERRAEEATRRRALAEDQERIARDLHDTVIQELFSIGLGLQALQARADDAEVTVRLGEAIDQIDDTIREVRTVIFGLHRDAASGAGLREAIAQVVDDLTRSLGFEPKVLVEGPLDHDVPADVGVHLVPTIREALTNIARHGRATSARIEITVADELVIDVTDDGCGIEPGVTRRSGLANLERRAALLGGRFVIQPHPTGGTHLAWRVPLARSGADEVG